jgi:EpsI family protein
MKAFNLRHFLIGLTMLAAAGLALAMVPRHKVADQGHKLNLESMIPQEFGEWRMQAKLDHLQVSPDVQAELDKIYNQTLTRTYNNDQGQHVMLSIAYGGDQSDSMTVHLPEGCYRGQGFDVKRNTPINLRVGDVEIPVMRLVAEKGARIEPISYWILIGDSFALDRTNRKLAQLRYSLTGQIPEGILIRVSSIDADAEDAYQTHQRFLEQMIASVPPELRPKLIGRLTR